MNVPVRHGHHEVQSGPESELPLPSVIFRRYLAPDQAVQRAHRSGLSLFVTQVHDLRPGSPEWEIRAAVEAAQKLPSPKELQDLLDALEPAAETLTGARAAEIIGAMLDSLPTFDARKAPGFVDLIMFAAETAHGAEPIATSGLAGAAYEIACSETFAPPPARLIELARTKTKGIESAVWLVRRALEQRARLVEIVATHKAENPSQPEGDDYA